MAAPAGRKGPKMELCVCAHILEKKAHIYMICILYKSSTFAGSDGTHISVNSVFLGALHSKSGCLSEKSGFFSIF